MTDRKSPSGPLSALEGTITFDAASCGAAAVTVQTLTIAGALPGDIALLAPPAAGLDVAVNIGIGYVSAANTVKVPFTNPTAGALNPAPAVYSYTLLRPNLP